MSVPVPKRKIGKLDVNVAACELCKGIIEITNNSNVFTEEYRSITDKMRDAALDVHLLCWEANNINVGDSAERYERRIELQSEAIDACNRLCALIELSKRLFHLPTRRAVHWIDETVKVRNNYIRKAIRDGIPKSKVDESYRSWRDHASKGNSYKMLCKMDGYYNKLWSEVLKNDQD